MNPENEISFFSKLTFSWFTELTWQACRSQLFQKNLWLLLKSNTAQKVMPPFDYLVKQYQMKGKKVNIMIVLLRLYWFHLLIISLIKLVASLMIFVNPIVFDWVIDYLNPQNTEPAWKGYFYATLMFIAPMLESMFTSQFEYNINTVTMKMRTCITCAIYDKSMRLSNEAKQRFTTGEIVNLTSIDSQRIADFINQINTIWAAPMQILIGLYLLWLQLGNASFAGFSYMLFVIPVNILFTKIIGTIQLKYMKEKDKRSKLMTEILDGIKVIKLNVWEDHFEHKTKSLREKEVVHLTKYAYCYAFMNSFFSSGAFLVSEYNEPTKRADRHTDLHFKIF